MLYFSVIYSVLINSFFTIFMILPSFWVCHGLICLDDGDLFLSWEIWANLCSYLVLYFCISWSSAQLFLVPLNCYYHRLYVYLPSVSPVLFLVSLWTISMITCVLCLVKFTGFRLGLSVCVCTCVCVTGLQQTREQTNKQNIVSNQLFAHQLR